MKIGDTIGTLCICSHPNTQHSKMGKKAWDRLDKQLEGYKESSMVDREAFWKKYLSEGTQEEWKCTQCNCEAFKMDNLRYLEEKLKEKEHGKNLLH